MAKSKVDSVGEVYIDEIETLVHSKYHPVSVAMAVAGRTRRFFSKPLRCQRVGFWQIKQGKGMVCTRISASSVGGLCLRKLVADLRKAKS
jgi:hypothetical protein